MFGKKFISKFFSGWPLPGNFLFNFYLDFLNVLHELRILQGETKLVYFKERNQIVFQMKRLTFSEKRGCVDVNCVVTDALK